MKMSILRTASGFILALSYSVFAAAPATFSQIAPTNFSLDVDIYPKLEWQASAGAESYVVRIGRSGGFTPGSYVDIPSDTNVTWPTQDLEKGSIQYYWKVAAIASNGLGGFDTTWSTGSRWQLQTIPLTMPTRIDNTDEIINPRTLLAANSPYTIRISMTCSTLTIPAGTTLLLGNLATININGSLYAKGTESNPIRIDYDSSDVSGNYKWYSISSSNGVPVVVDGNNNYISGNVLQWVNVGGGGFIAVGSDIMVDQVSMVHAGRLVVTGNSVVKDSRFISSGGVRGGKWLENVRIESGSEGWVSEGTTSSLTTVKNMQILGNSSYGFQYNRQTALDARKIRIEGNGSTAMRVAFPAAAHLEDVALDWHSKVNSVWPIPQVSSNGDLAHCGIDFTGDPMDWSLLWEVHTGTCSYPSGGVESARMYGSYLVFAGADTFMTKQLEGPKYNGYYLNMALWGTGNPHFEWQDEQGQWHTIRNFPDTTISGDYVKWVDSLYIPSKPERIRIYTTVANRTMRVNFIELYTANTNNYIDGLQLTGDQNDQFTLRNISIKNNSGKALTTSGIIHVDIDSLTIDRGDSTGVEINHTGKTKIRRLQSLNNKRNGFVHLSSTDTLDMKNARFAGNRNGGMRIQSMGTGLVDSCLFENDSAFATGGGLHIASLGAGLPARFTVSNSTFRSNRSANDGGGIFIDTNSAVNLINLTLERNFAVGNGGGLRSKSLQAPVNNLKFISDSANGLGGGAYLPLAPSNSAFLSNSASQGGGLYLYRPVDRIALNSFVQNKTNSSNGNGAALYLHQNVKKVEWNLFNGNYNSTSVIYGHTDTLRQNNLDRNPQIATIYRNTTGADVLGTHNWWGTRSDQIAIEGYLYHKVDQSALGLVTYQPFLSNPSDSVPGAVRNVSSVQFFQDSLYTIPAMGFYAPSTVDLWLELRGEDTNPYAYDPVVVVVENERTFASVAPILVETQLNSGIYRGKARLGTVNDLATNTLVANAGDSLRAYWLKDYNLGEWVQIAAAPNRAPVASTVDDKSIQIGSTLQVNLPAQDPDGDELSWTLVLQPGNLSFNLGSLSTWSWTPQLSQAGVYTATATVSDGSLTDQVTFEVTVRQMPVSIAQAPPRIERQSGRGWTEVFSTHPVHIRVLSLDGRLLAQSAPSHAGSHRLQWSSNGIVFVQVISKDKKWSWLQAE